MQQNEERITAPIEKEANKLPAPLSEFVSSQAASGLLLGLAVCGALAMANTPLQDAYRALGHTHLKIAFGDFSIDMSLHHWMNDGFMVLFFFVLGLEIKRELLAGELRDIRQSSLVFAMAAGGVLLPALVYVAIVQSAVPEAADGWGIPMATDAAFAIAILSLLGSRAPRAATVVLSALAILDDICAVLVISFFYSGDVQTASLAGAAATLLALMALNAMGIRAAWAYAVGGIVLWWWVLQSGVHATTAGIVAALVVPAKAQAETHWFTRLMPRVVERFEKIDHPDQSILERAEQHDLAEQALKVAEATTTPLQRWENRLDGPVSLLVIPAFAFLNAGVTLTGDLGEVITAPATLAVLLGLVLGKTAGIFGFAWLCLRLGWCQMPQGMRLIHLVGLGLLGGVGFTMSLFIASLAFSGSGILLEQAKVGILAGSLISALLGSAVFIYADRQPDSS